jgi:hypothetical protein
MVKDKDVKHEDHKIPPKALAEGHVEHKAKAPPRVNATHSGPYDDLIGTSDLKPGETGWLSIIDGVPTGLYRYPPAAGNGVFACAALVALDEDGDKTILTASGAPFGTNVNPNPDFRYVQPDVAEIAAQVKKYEEKRSHPHIGPHVG